MENVFSSDEFWLYSQKKNRFRKSPPKSIFLLSHLTMNACYSFSALLFNLQRGSFPVLHNFVTSKGNPTTNQNTFSHHPCPDPLIAATIAATIIMTTIKSTQCDSALCSGVLEPWVLRVVRSAHPVERGRKKCCPLKLNVFFSA